MVVFTEIENHFTFHQCNNSFVKHTHYKNNKGYYYQHCKVYCVDDLFNL